ncbi:MAG: peptidase superfamily protein [Planctomycetaceae bacterium]|nr:peptidase superfamily protein [Planctomycetaceae bacterium]
MHPATLVKTASYVCLAFMLLAAGADYPVGLEHLGAILPAVLCVAAICGFAAAGYMDRVIKRRKDPHIRREVTPRTPESGINESTLPDFKLSAIPKAFHLPRVDWDVVHQWMEQHIPESDRSQAWTQLATEWLEALNQALGNEYRVVRSEHLILFAPQDYEHTDVLLKFGESGLDRIDADLGDLAKKSDQVPLAILLFRDADSYCRYTSPFDPEGAFLRSAGVCLRDGYVHIALRPYPLDTLQVTMLHEITHACLSHLELPLWLEEGITQMAEQAPLPVWSRFSLNREDASEIRQYWREQGLNDFWWGTGFQAIGAPQDFCYQLAHILFRLLISEHKQRVPEFVRRASAADAGECAARDALGKSLPDIAAMFLGPGEWAAVPHDCATYNQRGAFYLTRKEYDRAIADFNSALSINDRSYETYANRGWAYCLSGHDTASIVDCERGIELNSKDYLCRNNLAWILATSTDENLRDGDRAVELATLACENSDYSAWYCLGTLGAAYAEAGDFEEALRWARESFDLAPEEEQADCKMRIKLYKEEQPFREDPVPPAETV